jgi:NADPH2:quinone reductase
MVHDPSMRAIRALAPGGPDAMRLDEVDTPAPGPGQVLVRVEYAGVNFIDVYHRSGQYPLPLPIALGREGAGVIEGTGERVAWAGVPGSYATHVVAPTSALVPVPDGVTTENAAALMLQGMTAHYLTQSTFPLRAEHTALLHAAAGGAGLLVAQLARRVGATLIGTCSSDAKADAARAAGCTHVIRYDREDFVARTRELTGGRGVDVVYDSVGMTTFAGGLECLRPRGTMVLFGQSSGAVPPFDLQQLNARGSLYVTRPNLAHYTATRDELLARAADVLASLTPTIARILPLADAAEAHRLLESRATSGKLLLRCL